MTDIVDFEPRDPNTMKLSSILIPVIFLTFLSCNKDNNEDLEFCNSITQGNYSETLPVINDFLNDLIYDDIRNLGENSNMEILGDWLEQKPCISDVEIKCFWCEYSIPSTSTLYIMLSEDSDTLVLRIYGSIPNIAMGLSEK